MKTNLFLSYLALCFTGGWCASWHSMAADSASSSVDTDPVISQRFPLRYAQATDLPIYQTSDKSKSIVVPGVVTLLTNLLAPTTAPKTKATADPNAKNVVSFDPDVTKAFTDSSTAFGNMATALKASATGGKIPTPAHESGIPNIMAHPRQNAVVIWDRKSHMPFFDQLIRKMDRKRPMIEVSVRAIDVDTTVASTWDMNLLGAGSKRIAGKNVTVIGSSTPNGTATPGGSATLDPLLNGLTAKPSKTAPSGFGTNVAEGSPFTLAGLVAGDNSLLIAELNVLESHALAKQHLEQHVNTLPNIPASYMDQSVLYVPVSGINFSNIFEVPIVSRVSVTPRIVKDGPPGSRLVQLTVAIADSASTTSTTNPQVNNNPVIQTSSLITEAVVSEKGSLMLAGSYRNETDDARNGAPILGRIPLVGRLFTQKNDTRHWTQRFFLISAHILDGVP